MSGTPRALPNAMRQSEQYVEDLLWLACRLIPSARILPQSKIAPGECRSRVYDPRTLFTCIPSGCTTLIGEATTDFC